MNTIILVYALVLCDGNPNPRHQTIQTSPKAFENDIQLIRMGWYNPLTDSRCKAIKMRYETVRE